ncbi:MAG TPA: CapA family protein, partial [Patescibacteria group bacterium]|nr:CapA family protein [Patescibacteria group bacterium]
VQSADVAIGNLESPIIAGEPVPTGSFSFRADPRSAEALKIAGFDILSLPNNHIGNFGQEGWAKTFEYLKANELEYVGAGKKLDEMVNPLIKEVKGIKMAFLAYGYGPVEYRATGKNAGMAIMDMEQLIQDINEAKEQGADLIIVSMHDGVEYVNDPSEHQRTFARAAIDAGADLVLGHHPHVVQKMELYKEKYIFYSLGNFVFDQMWSQDTREGLGLMIHMNKEGVTEIEYHPVVIDDYCQPNLATGEAAEAIISRLN